MCGGGNARQPPVAAGRARQRYRGATRTYAGRTSCRNPRRPSVPPPGGLPDSALELVGVGRVEAHPSRLPVDRVEFDEWGSERVRQSRSERALPRRAVSDDVDAFADLSHHFPVCRISGKWTVAKGRFPVSVTTRTSQVSPASPLSGTPTPGDPSETGPSMTSPHGAGRPQTAHLPHGQVSESPVRTGSAGVLGPSTAVGRGRRQERGAQCGRGAQVAPGPRLSGPRAGLRRGPLSLALLGGRDSRASLPYPRNCVSRRIHAGPSQERAAFG